MENLTNLLPAAAVLLVGFGLVAGILYLHNRWANRFTIPAAELANLRRHYKPSLSQLIKVVMWGLITSAVIAIVYNGTSNANERVLGILIGVPVVGFLLISDLAILLRGSIRISNGRVIYHSGWRVREFTLDGITSCQHKSYEVYEISHRQDSGKPIRIGNNFGKFYEFILICRYFAALNNQPGQPQQAGQQQQR